MNTNADMDKTLLFTNPRYIRNSTYKLTRKKGTANRREP